MYIDDNKSWKELGAAEKLKLTLASFLVLASIVIGFVSFIILYEIPGSVNGLIGIWLSTACALFGITSYFHNELVQFKAHVNETLEQIDNRSNDDVS